MNKTMTTHSSGTPDELSEGVRLHQSGQKEEALRHYMNALEQNSSNPGILSNIAVALHDCERYDEAVTIYNHVLSLTPDSAEAHHNLGNTLLAMERLHEAIACYGRAASLMPYSAEPLVPMGTALERLGCYQEAMVRYKEALQRDPFCAEAHWNQALLNLLLGNYEEGWQGFEWRWKKKGYPTPARNFCCPEWKGESITGKTILIHAEQGLGDTIQFGRYIPLVAERGGRILLEVPLPLTSLFSRMPGVIKVIQTGARLPSFDLHVPLLSLPRIFGTTPENIPSTIPYLSVPVQHKKKWDLLFPRNSSLNVGIVWKGRKRPDPCRSCPGELLTSLSGMENIRFYSLQMSEDSKPADKPEGLPLIDLTSWINDFSDTAALLEHLDLVISIDTSVAHLSGSLGCPTWVLLPFAADWRWMLNRNDSAWYPDVRLFRQSEPGGWKELLKIVREELLIWSASTSNRIYFNTAPMDANGNSSLRFFSYISDRDFHLGQLHDAREVPIPHVGEGINSDKAGSADYYILNKDLYKLQNNLGIEGVSRFIKEL
ncbi:MAG: tetratricopeptide repeat-containing glycosyltransferase family protein, partial [Pedobacter sp.]